MGSPFLKHHRLPSRKNIGIFYSFLFLVGGLFIFTLPVHAASSVIINEIQTTGASDADDEFIELWDGGDAAVVIEDWSLQYKTATGTTITKRNFEKGAAIPARGYYLIATKEYKGTQAPDLMQSTISLAKSGGNLFLVRNQEVIMSKDDPDIVDRIAWGTGDSAEGSAVQAPDSGQSIARADGVDTDNNAKDFSIRTTPTPSNTKSVGTIGGTVDTMSVILSPSSDSTVKEPAQKEKTTKESTKEQKGTLSITEVLPNPVGSDEREFIEIQNTGDAPIILVGWRITSRLDQEYVFKEGVLTSKEYILLTREKTGLALQNDREELRLFAPAKDRATETVKWSNAPEGSSLMRDADDDFVWTVLPTPGAVNQLVVERRAPRVTLHAPKGGGVGELLTFDASDSFDPEGEALTFQWDFGDGYGKGEGARATYIYLTPGTFTLTVTAIDKEGFATTETQKIKITGEDLLAPPTQPPLLLGEGSLPRANAKLWSRGVRSPKIEATTRVAATAASAPRNGTRKNPLASGTIRGVVTVPPGVLAKTYMYLLCEMPCEGESIKVRMARAEWPELQKGDVLTISGKTSTAGSEPSFLTRKEWVRVMEERRRITAKNLPPFRELDDALLNHLVTARGELTEKKSRLLYLDDGTGELPVSLKAATKFIAEGDTVTVAGILTKNQKGYLLKASEAPIVVSAQPKTKQESLKIVRDKGRERTKYLVTTLAVLLALAARPIFLFVQKRKKKIET